MTEISAVAAVDAHAATPAELNDAERARLADVAELYWVQGLKVEDVGRRLHLSRSTVSRMLAKARQAGVVEFTVHRTLDRSAVLAQQLSHRYGINVWVVPTPADAGAASRLDTVASRAAEHLSMIVTSDMVIAVAWGATIEAVSRHLDGRPTHGTRIVQLNGSGNVFSTGSQYAGQILERFGRAFAASVHYFPVPAFFDSAATREAMWQERSIERILRMRRNADVLVSSIGTLTSELPGHLYRSGYLTATEIQDLHQQGVVGDLGAIFFRADGSSDIPVNDRSTGMPTDELRLIRTRLLVVSDPTKAVALRAALDAGFITDLFTDDATARAVLER